MFISYTAEDLVRHADAVVAAVRRLEWIAVDHRDWAASGMPSVEACKERVRGCDILVVLVAHRYGWKPTKRQGGDARRSITWIEVDEARDAGKPVVPFIVEDDAAWPPRHIEALERPEVATLLAEFKAKLNEAIRGTFTGDPTRLEGDVSRALAETERRMRAAKKSRVSKMKVAKGKAGPAWLAEHRRRLEERYRFIELIGFGADLQVKLPITEVYVPLKATMATSLEDGGAKAGKYDAKRLAEAGFHLRGIPLEDAFREAKQRDLRGIALLGDPGAGKTTAARLLCWTCVNPAQGPTSLRLPVGTVPVLLRLRRLQPESIKRMTGLGDFLCEELATSDVPGSEELGKRLLKRGGLLWILDGLDEVASTKDRAQVSKWIRNALKNRPKDHFLVTCRYAGYEDDAVLGADFLQFNVESLSPEQQEDFVGRWYRTVEVRVRGAGSEARKRADERTKQLVSVLRSPDFRSRRLTEMVENPLLLSILCIVHRRDVDLPRRRSELYDKCVAVLLKHWREAWRKDQGVRPIDVTAARAVLRPLAWYLQQEEDRTEAAGVDLAREAETTLGTLSPSAGLGRDGSLFLERMRSESGLLVTPDPGQFSFLHKSFQEYLAARYACDTGRATDLSGHFDEPWWQEVILLALSEANAAFAEDFFTAVLKDSRTDLSGELFTWCVRETLHFPVKPFAAALVRKPQSRVRLAALLRELRGRDDAELVTAVKALRSRRSAAELRSQIEEFLTLAGEAPEPVSQADGKRTIILEPAGIAMVLVPEGHFLMGSLAKERRSYPDERPRHKVEVPAFLMARDPVTNGQYKRFLEANPGRSPPSEWSNRRLNQENQPVVGVSWNDAQSFCKWAKLRLPTEAEWEYACRAGTTTWYWSGNDESDLARVGWYGKNSGGRPHPVGEKPANPWGLHDMHGNVREWCEDTWHETYKGAPTNGTAWVDQASGDRVVRGGSWLLTARLARSAFRGWGVPGGRRHFLGFRPARSVTAD